MALDWQRLRRKVRVIGASIDLRGHASSADRFNSHRDLLTGKAEIAVPHGPIRNKFLKGSELVLLPVGVVEIFVEEMMVPGTIRSANSVKIVRVEV